MQCVVCAYPYSLRLVTFCFCFYIYYYDLLDTNYRLSDEAHRENMELGFSQNYDFVRICVQCVSIFGVWHVHTSQKETNWF